MDAGTARTAPRASWRSHVRRAPEQGAAGYPDGQFPGRRGDARPPRGCHEGLDPAREPGTMRGVRSITCSNPSSVRRPGAPAPSSCSRSPPTPARLLLLAATALWRVDKLGAEDAQLTVASLPGAPTSVGDEPAAKPERPREEKKPRRVTREVTQADRDAQATDDDSGSSGEAGEGDGEGAGGPAGPASSPAATAAGARPSSIRPTPPRAAIAASRPARSATTATAPLATAAPPPAKEEERIVVAHLIEGSRIEGNPRIEPPDSVRQAMARAGQDKVKGLVKMCLDREGQVRSLAILRSTGHAEYDQRLLAGMRSWRYRPYRFDSGVAVAGLHGHHTSSIGSSEASAPGPAHHLRRPDRRRPRRARRRHRARRSSTAATARPGGAPRTAASRRGFAWSRPSRPTTRCAPRRTCSGADGTLLVTRGMPTGGSALTAALARKHDRALLHSISGASASRCRSSGSGWTCAGIGCSERRRTTGERMSGHRARGARSPGRPRSPQIGACN